MFDPIKLRRAGVAMAVGLALAAVPGAAHAAAIDLGGADSFVVLGGSAVTNTGPSVLNGDLGVSTGSSITGFPPGLVNGTVHQTDGVAALAQSNLTTAYNVAAGEPPAANLSDQDLGGLTLTAGTYKYDFAAQLTGALVLDAQGDPNARFLFQIGSALTTASSSSVVLINGASPCNVFWQVGSSATLGTTSAFTGNIMALTSVTLTTGATVQGRALAQTGAVTLDTNTLNRPNCTTPPPPASTPTPVEPGPTATTPVGTTPTPTTSGAAPTTGTTNQAPPASRSRVATRNGSATFKPTSPTSGSSSTSSKAPFRATVRGRQIDRVVFSLDGKRISSRSGSTFTVSVPASAGSHKLTARVTFKDATSAKTLTLRYRGQTTQVLQPRHGPSQFTG